MLGARAPCVNLGRSAATSRPAALTRPGAGTNNAKATSGRRRRGIGGPVIVEHSRFQLEATKLGRDITFQVTVFEREERKRKRLFAETQCSDPFHLIIQFIIREAPDFETLLARFVQQLEHRGFVPARMRMRSDGKWEAWTAVPGVGVGPTEAAPDPPALETAQDKPLLKSKAR